MQGITKPSPPPPPAPPWGDRDMSMSPYCTRLALIETFLFRIPFKSLHLFVREAAKKTLIFNGRAIKALTPFPSSLMDLVKKVFLNGTAFTPPP